MSIKKPFATGAWSMYVPCMFHVYQEDPSTHGLLPPTIIKSKFAGIRVCSYRYLLFTVFKAYYPRFYMVLSRSYQSIVLGGISCGRGGGLEALISFFASHWLSYWIIASYCLAGWPWWLMTLPGRKVKEQSKQILHQLIGGIAHWFGFHPYFFLAPSRV